MATIQGFLKFRTFTSNLSSNDNVVGELSQKAATFALDPKEYSKSNVTLHIAHASGLTAPQLSGFNAVQDVVATTLNNFINIETEQSAEWDFPVAIPATTPFINAVTAIVNAGGALQLTGTGPIVFNPGLPANGDNRHYPAWIEFNYIQGGATGWNYRIWLVDAYYRTEYQQVAYRIVPPVNNLNTFFTSYPAAKAECAINRRAPALAARVQGWIDDNYNRVIPTGWDVVELSILNPLNSNDTCIAAFAVLFNGDEGRTQEAMVQAIKDYLVANSTYPAEQGADENYWYRIIPELTPEDVFFIVPNWAATIPGAGELRSSLLPCDNALATEVINTYFGDHVTEAGSVADALEMLGYGVAVRNSLGFFGMAAMNNQHGWQAFTDAFPDYATLATTSQYINALQSQTRAFIHLLDVMLEVARTYTVGSVLPDGYSVFDYSGFRWIAGAREHINLYVLTRESAAP